ncbi:MAG: hypothetical protein FWF88_08275 [Peptococcaceae bacterium]|nr:hypothetical protein [Peptococcaceae bacterium]
MGKDNNMKQFSMKKTAVLLLAAAIFSLTATACKEEIPEAEPLKPRELNLKLRRLLTMPLSFW